jgi:hypothetical protein
MTSAVLEVVIDEDEVSLSNSNSKPSAGTAEIARTAVAMAVTNTKVFLIMSPI